VVPVCRAADLHRFASTGRSDHGPAHGDIFNSRVAGNVEIPTFWAWSSRKLPGESGPRDGPPGCGAIKGASTTTGSAASRVCLKIKRGCHRYAGERTSKNYRSSTRCSKERRDHDRRWPQAQSVLAAWSRAARSRLRCHVQPADGRGDFARLPRQLCGRFPDAAADQSPSSPPTSTRWPKSAATPLRCTGSATAGHDETPSRLFDRRSWIPRC
jgi:hypothetical protein